MRRAVGALLRKELALERRAPMTLAGMVLFSVTTFVVFHFALDEASVDGELASGVLVVTLLFAAMLGINRLFVTDQEEGGFDALRLAPVDHTALFVAKALALLGFLAALEAVALPVFALLLLGPGLTLELVGQAAVVLLLADVGIAVVGTLVAALGIQTRARDLLVPLIALPLLVPVVIGSARGMEPLLQRAGSEGLDGRWLLILALYDLVFGLLAYAVFDFLLEE